MSRCAILPSSLSLDEIERRVTYSTSRSAAGWSSTETAEVTIDLLANGCPGERLHSSRLHVRDASLDLLGPGGLDHHLLRIATHESHSSVVPRRGHSWSATRSMRAGVSSQP